MEDMLNLKGKKLLAFAIAASIISSLLLLYAIIDYRLDKMENRIEQLEQRV